jgi:hypothetical protein
MLRRLGLAALLLLSLAACDPDRALAPYGAGVRIEAVRGDSLAAELARLPDCPPLAVAAGPMWRRDPLHVLPGTVPLPPAFISGSLAEVVPSGRRAPAELRSGRPGATWLWSDRRAGWLTLQADRGERALFHVIGAAGPEGPTRRARAWWAGGARGRGARSSPRRARRPTRCSWRTSTSPRRRA